MKAKKVSVKKLTETFQFLADESEPYDIWGTRVTLQDILDCIKNNVIESTPYFVAQMQGIDNYNHAARIAYLVKNRDTTPIELDVGCPSLGYYDMSVSDGNHRVVAAMIRGDDTILVYVGGELSYFRHVFVKPLKKYSQI